MSFVCCRILCPFSCLLIFCLTQCEAGDDQLDYNLGNLSEISNRLDKAVATSGESDIAVNDTAGSDRDNEYLPYAQDDSLNSSSNQEYEEEGIVSDAVIEQYKTKYQSVLGQYEDIINGVDFTGSLKGRGVFLSFPQFSDEDLPKILYFMDNGYNSDDISRYMASEKVLDGQGSEANGSSTKALPFEMSVEVLSALRKGINVEKILEQFDIALNEKILDFSIKAHASDDAPYKIINNLLRSLSNPAYDREPGFIGKIFWYFYGMNSNTLKFSRVAHALIPGLFDKFWKQLKEANLDGAVEKIISSEAFSSGGFEESCVSTIYLISGICNALDSGISPNVVSGLLKGISRDKSAPFDEALDGFYESLAFAYRNCKADFYLLENSDLLGLSEFACGSHLGIYLESLLKSGISNAFKYEVSGFDDYLDSVVKEYKELCKVIESAVSSNQEDNSQDSEGINLDELFAAIVENREEPGLTDLTKGTASAVRSLIEELRQAKQPQEILEIQEGVS